MTRSLSTQPAVNAIVSLPDRDELLADAAVGDDETARDRSRGRRNSMSQTIKDLAEIKELHPTMSVIF